MWTKILPGDVFYCCNKGQIVLSPVILWDISGYCQKDFAVGETFVILEKCRPFLNVPDKIKIYFENSIYIIKSRDFYHFAPLSLTKFAKRKTNHD